jgi:hypothetical protein
MAAKKDMVNRFNKEIIMMNNTNQKDKVKTIQLNEPQPKKGRNIRPVNRTQLNFYKHDETF